MDYLESLLHVRLARPCLMLIIKVRKYTIYWVIRFKILTEKKKNNILFNGVLGQPTFSEADLARSLLLAISNDIGQIASLYATVHKMSKVYFGGYFLRNHPVSMHTISYSIKYWSHVSFRNPFIRKYLLNICFVSILFFYIQGKVKPLFLRHEGYLGAIGAFLYGAEQSDQHSWLENYAGSSGFKDSISTDLGIKVDQLEIDQAENAVTFCPLLKDPATYNPDTTDLAEDKEAR